MMFLVLLSLEKVGVFSANADDVCSSFSFKHRNFQRFIFSRYTWRTAFRIFVTQRKRLCNVNQQNALLKFMFLFSSSCFSTCFEYLMFIIRKTILYMQSYMVCIEHILHPARLLAYMQRKRNIQGCIYNIVFLKINIRWSKHVEDKKNWIKTLI
jgi:hypothetical protein